jgi:ClpP class serine protease
MSVSELFWLFVIVMALQPMVKQRFLEITRGRAIARLERERGSRVIVLVHRQETLSLLGIPIFRFINLDDAERMIRAIRMTDDQVPIDLVLHTPGGLVLPSLQIARAIARHPGKVTAFVPHYAMSGGTLIALAADEIVMSEDAVLGPVDPQLGGMPAASILRAVAQKPKSEIDDDTLVMADQAEMAIRQLRESVRVLVEGRLPPTRAEALAETLAEGRWTHDYAISCDEARAMGLTVTTALPAAIHELMELYPQPMRRQPSVEFLPTRRRFTPPKRARDD